MNERDLLADCLQRLNRTELPYMLTGSMVSNYGDSISPSERQRGDAAGVVAVQEAALDTEYLRFHARQLGVHDVLEALLAGSIRPKQT